MNSARAIGPDDIIGVIPARWGATRFPGKMLASIAGRPLITWVVRGCRRSRRVTRWIVATDDQRIAVAAAAAGAGVVMTSRGLKSGSDRVAQAVANERVAWVVNWQGDEWLPNGRPIDLLVAALERDDSCSVATLVRPLPPVEARNPNRVKVVVSRSGRALYFSRAPIPHDSTGKAPFWLHVGVYGFARRTLLEFAGWPQTPLEKQEKLEQLRLLEHDVPIAVARSRVATYGIDTPADARALARRLRPGRRSQ
ncbi:MAG: 3-deoxy-manno-octulosonate cytidylyltransferase [Candidatus Zixiibacteriota bacterium]